MSIALVTASGNSAAPISENLSWAMLISVTAPFTALFSCAQAVKLVIDNAIPKNSFLMILILIIITITNGKTIPKSIKNLHYTDFQQLKVVLLLHKDCVIMGIKEFNCVKITHHILR